MKRMLVFKRNKYWYYYLLLILFVLLKMLRGASQISSIGGLWNYIQLFFVLSGFVFLFKHQQELVCIKLMFVFCVWNGLVSILNTDSYLITFHDWFQFMCLPIAPCTLLIFYTISKDKQIKDFLLVITVVFFILSYLYYSNIKLYRVNILLGDEEAEMMTSDVYFLVGLLPAVLIFLKKKWSFIPFLLLLFLTTLSGKRGAMISVASMAFVYYITDMSIKRRGNIFRIILFVLLIVVSVYLIIYVDDSYGTRSIDRLGSVSEDGGSGRTGIWARVLYAIGESGAFQLLFGHGFNSIYTLLRGMRAHNDFLDIFYCYGFISFVLFVIIYISLITTNIRMYKAKYVYARIFTGSLIYALICSMVSYYFVDNTFIVCGMFSCGLVLGDWTKYKKNLNLKANIP